MRHAKKRMQISTMRNLAFACATVVATVTAAPLLAQSQRATDSDLMQLPVESLVQTAEAGNAQGQFILAEKMRLGQGAIQDLAGAMQWYRAAADQGHAGAQNGLAGLMAAGLAGEAGLAEALIWFEKAADQGDPKHIADLALAYEQGLGAVADPARAAGLYQQASDAGLSTASVSLAVLYIEGRGVPMDPARAAQLLIAPAEAGDGRALNNLGMLYSRGDGVEQNYELAAKLFQTAADQGQRVAMQNLGVMYENGFGVPQSKETATQWYRRASSEVGSVGGVLAEPYLDPRLPKLEPAYFQQYLATSKTGDPLALYQVAILLLGDNQTRAAAQMLEKAANKGLAPAMANLGRLHVIGDGVLQDYETGYMWLSLAAASGLPGISELRDAAGTKMTLGQINAANAMAEEKLKAIIGPAISP